MSSLGTSLSLGRTRGRRLRYDHGARQGLRVSEQFDEHSRAFFRQAQGSHGHIPPAGARTRCQSSLPFERTGKSSLQRCQDRSGKACPTRRRKPWAAQEIILDK